MIWVLIGILALAVLLKPESIMVVNDKALSDFKSKWYNTAFFWGNYHNVPIELILAVIYKESRGDPNAQGKTGDWGLMQITQPALTDYNTHRGASYQIIEMLNPNRCVDVGTWYLSWLHSHYGLDWADTLRAYNVGIGNVLKSKEAGKLYASSVLEIQNRLEMV